MSETGQIVKFNTHDLHQALLSGGESDVRGVLNHGKVDVNAIIRGYTALSLCVYTGKIAMVRLLLEHPNCRKKFDFTILSQDERRHNLEPVLVAACRLLNVEAVTLLLEHGADVEVTSSFQQTPLWIAVCQRNIKLVKVLLAHGARSNPSPEHCWMHSPLYFATRYPSRLKIAKLLILHGASAKFERSSLLRFALLKGDRQLIHLIVESGYNVTADIRSKEMCFCLIRKNSDSFGWLHHEIKHPQSLIRQCRTAIRQTVSGRTDGSNFVKQMGRLGLPRQLENYLLLNFTVEDLDLSKYKIPPCYVP